MSLNSKRQTTYGLPHLYAISRALARLNIVPRSLPSGRGERSTAREGGHGWNRCGMGSLVLCLVQAEQLDTKKQETQPVQTTSDWPLVGTGPCRSNKAGALGLWNRSRLRCRCQPNGQMQLCTMPLSKR